VDKPGTLRIRSYRLCFELERRIHKVDRWRIPVPYGVPLRGIAYGLAALVAVLWLQRLPAAGELLRLLHPALRLVVLPVALAYLLCRVRVDGRTAHGAGLAWLRFRLGPRRLSSLRAAPRGGTVRLDGIAMAADETADRYRPGLIEGPCELTLRYPARATARRRTLELRQAGDRPLWRGKRLRLAAGQRLRLR
jgi:hypothetical protein